MIPLWAKLWRHGRTTACLMADIGCLIPHLTNYAPCIMWQAVNSMQLAKGRSLTTDQGRISKRCRHLKACLKRISDRHFYILTPSRPTSIHPPLGQRFAPHESRRYRFPKKYSLHRCCLPAYQCAGRASRPWLCPILRCWRRFCPC